MTKRKIGIMTVITIIFLAVPIWLYSYSESTTHPALTWEMVEFFNKSFPQLALTSEEREWVIKGSQDEDTWPRWINHFYNPKTNEGWEANHFGIFSSTTARGLVQLLLSDYPPVPAKYWAVMPMIQAQYKSFGGDRTWQRALTEWSRGNKKEAYYTLGHILHLLEDMTVPDHTRDDTHAHPLQVFTGDVGSPYELYAQRYVRENGKTNLPVTASHLFSSRVSPVVLPNLTSYFTALAHYSYNYFYSKDTIDRFVVPKIVSFDDDFGYGKDDDGSLFPLARRKLARLKGFSLSIIFSLDDPIADAPILQAYFERLSRRTIVYGAGAMKLFRNEADKLLASGSQPALVQEKNGINSTLRSLKDVNQQVSDVVKNTATTIEQVVRKVVPQVLGEKIEAVPPKVSPATDTVSVAVVVAPVPEQFVQVQPFSSPYGSGGTGSVTIQTAPVMAPSSLPAPSLPIVTTTPVTVATVTPFVSGLETPSTTVNLVTTTPTVPMVTTTPPALGPETTSTTDSMATTTPESVFSTTKLVDHVVVNEIGWAGTSSEFPNDEWFEVYNPTSEPVDMAGWKITVGQNAIGWKRLVNSIVAPGGYLLFEKNRDEVVREIAADVVYDGASFNDVGDTIVLRNASGVVVDQVDFSSGWPNATRRHPAERISYLVTSSFGWSSADDFRMTGRTYTGGMVYGSPRQANSGGVALTLRQEETVRKLTKAENPYILGVYEIPTGAQLIIEPGVVITSFSVDSKVDVFGDLRVSGDSEPVILTSGKNTPEPGDWQGLWFHPGSSGDLRGVQLLYAGKSFRTNGSIFTGLVSQAIRAEQARLTISNSAFISNRSTTLYLSETPTNIQDVSFKNGDLAIESLASPLEIQGTLFSGYRDSKGPVHVFDRWPKLASLVFSENTFNGPAIFSVTVSGTEYIQADWPYFLSNSSIAEEASIRVSAGAKVFLPRASVIDVRGQFIAEGTAEKPITMSAFESGQTWDSLKFNQGYGQLQHVIMTEGNGTVNGRSGSSGMVMLGGGSVVRIANSTLVNADNSGYVVYSDKSSLTIDQSTIGQSEKRQWPTTGVGLVSGNARLHDVFFTHLEVGIRSLGDPLPVLQLDGITDDHFIDVHIPFDPPFSGATSTP